MRGSGLSLERFIKGKAQRTKSDAKSKKKSIIHKAQRRRQYDKVKKREGSASIGGDSAAGSSFYDRFFSELKSNNVDEDANEVEAQVERHEQEVVERKHVMKPDPFYRAKKKAAVTKMEKQKTREEKQKQKVAAEKKVTQRKKRHVKLSQRTATGQPVVKHHIHDILSRLQAEKKRDGK